MVAAASGEGGFTPPSIMDFFPAPFAFAGTPFEMNRIILVRLVMLAVFILISVLYVRRAKLIPGRAQNMFEMLVDFVRENICYEMIGKELGRRFAPIIQLIFFTVLFMNIAGIIPGLNIAGSSIIGLPIVLAVISYVSYIYAGISQQGAIPYFKSQLFPAGAPKIMYLLLTPIEFLSNFVIRPVTLVIRLMINMMAGHFLMALCLLATHFFLVDSFATGYMAAGAITLTGAIVFTFFEIFVAVLQAYIFALLTAAYIQLSVSAH